MKNPLIEKLLDNPLGFDSNDFSKFIAHYRDTATGHYDSAAAFADLRECVRRIYDLNESQLLETSNANSGTLGKLNKRSCEKRTKAYYKKVANQKPGKKYIKIYAEGDSWFLFPIFVKDVVDWLEEEDSYLLYCEAYGGDWITNIIYEGQYIQALSTHRPDVFMVSGGGNDLVGNSRMAIMIDGAGQQQPYTTNTQLVANGASAVDIDMITMAQPFITKEFHAFIKVMKLQYTILFNNLYFKGSKHEKMITITQGYAYPYPKKGNNFSWKYPLQPIVNSFAETGQWLFRPLMLRGILDKTLQRAIVYTFIYEFNEMMKQVAAQYVNVYHVDARNIPLGEDDWYDELHLKSHVFKKVANLYKNIINTNVPGQPVKVNIPAPPSSANISIPEIDPANKPT